MENQVKEEERRKNYNYTEGISPVLASVILIILTATAVGAVWLLIHILIPSSKSLDFQQWEKCKFDAWEKCGLDLKENRTEMCWKLENNTEERYFDCQIITEKQRDCWLDKEEKCKLGYDRYLNETVEKEKANGQG